MFFPVAEITGCGRAGSLIITPRGPSRPFEAILEMIFNSEKRVTLTVQRCTKYCAHIVNDPGRAGKQQQEHISINLERTIVNLCTFANVVGRLR